MPFFHFWQYVCKNIIPFHWKGYNNRLVAVVVVVVVDDQSDAIIPLLAICLQKHNSFSLERLR